MNDEPWNNDPFSHELFSPHQWHVFDVMLSRLQKRCGDLLERMPGQLTAIFAEVCQEVYEGTRGCAHVVLHRYRFGGSAHAPQFLSTLPSLPITFAEEHYGYLVLSGDAGQAEQSLLSKENAEQLVSFLSVFFHLVEINALLYARIPGLAERKVNLTEREREVLTLMCRGYGEEAIARKLSLSRRTVERHRQNIYKKLGVRNAQDASLAAFLKGFYSPLLDELAIRRERGEQQN